MNTLHLKYFSRVYETLNFSRAAEELYISRQALRQDIHSLEAEVGQPLFINKANKLNPTPAADTLYKKSRAAVRELAKLDTVVESLRANASATIKCGLITNITDCFSDEEHEFYKSSPDKWTERTENITYSIGSSASLKKMVASGELDCAQIVVTRPVPKRFDSFVGASGRIHLYVNKNHPLAKRKTVSVKDLKNQRLATQGEGYDLHDFIINRCQKEGFIPTISVTAAHTNDVLSNIITNNIVSIGTLSNFCRYNMPDIVSIPFYEDFMLWQLVIIARQGEIYPGSTIERIFTRMPGEFHKSKKGA